MDGRNKNTTPLTYLPRSRSAVKPFLSSATSFTLAGFALLPFGSEPKPCERE
jgi:hypothetical protein